MTDRFHLPDPPGELLRELCDLALEIEDALCAGGDASALLARFRALSGNEIPPELFRGYYGAYTTEQFVRICLVPEPIPDPTITDDELRELIRRLLVFDCPDDAHAGYWRRILEVNIPHPAMGELLETADPSDADDVLRRAREHRPICL